MFSSPENNIEKSGIQPGMKVADFGAGTGAYTFLISRVVSGAGKVYAIDIQKDLLAKLKKEADEMGLKNIEVIWADLDRPKGTGLQTMLCDKVLLANTLFQVEDRDAVLDEVERILKPSGELILIDWTGSFSGMGPRADHVLTKDAAQVLVSEHGLDFVREFDAGDQHYGLIFKKK